MQAARKGASGIRRRAVRVAVRFVALAAVAYVVGFVPIVPFLPVCYVDGPDGAERRTLVGLMTEEFAEGLSHQAYLEGRHQIGNVVFITVGEWIEGYWYPYEITHGAIWHVLMYDRGISFNDVDERRISLPAFSVTWPTCEAVRAIAFRGGKWSREGPSPIWYEADGESRPAGYKGGRVPDWRDGDPWTSFDVELRVWLGVNIAFGIALGYLWAVWRERSMRRSLAKGAAFGLLLSVVIPLAFLSFMHLANR